jgi:hypothetical protein
MGLKSFPVSVGAGGGNVSWWMYSVTYTVTSPVKCKIGDFKIFHTTQISKNNTQQNITFKCVFNCIAQQTQKIFLEPLLI